MISKVYADLSKVLPTMYHFCIKSSRRHRGWVRGRGRATGHKQYRHGGGNPVKVHGADYPTTVYSGEKSEKGEGVVFSRGP